MRNNKKNASYLMIIFIVMTSCSWTKEPNVDPCEGSGHNGTIYRNDLTKREEKSFCGTIELHEEILHQPGGSVHGYRYISREGFEFVPRFETFDLIMVDGSEFFEAEFDVTFDLSDRDAEIFDFNTRIYTVGNVKLINSIKSRIKTANTDQMLI